MLRHPRRVAIAVHGGVGNSRRNEDGCVAAAERGFAVLREQGEALSAAVAAVVALEDDPRFNAGTGSLRRAGGRVVETDAAVADTRGRLGAVACLQRVKNPVLVARRVAHTRYWMLAGQGALDFARAEGFPDHDLAPDAPAGSAAGEESCDTVGAVALDVEGHFAVAISTGGSAPAILGRVGDTPIFGCGYYLGEAGAVCATGVGEHIVARTLAREVYGWMASGMRVRDALERGVEAMPAGIGVGLIAITRTAYAAASSREMPVHFLQQDE